MHILAAFWRSATSFSFYKDILEQPFSASIRYFIVLAVVATIFMSSRYNYSLYRDMNKMAQWVVENIPPVTIERGVVRAQAREPYVLEDDSSAIIIDTTGTTPSLDPKYKSGLLIGKENMYVRLNSIKEKGYRFTKIDLFILGCGLAASFIKPDVMEKGVVELSLIQRVIFDQAHVEQWKKKVIIAGSVLFPFFYFIYFAVFKLIQAAFFGFVIIFSNRTLKEAGITYDKVLNLCIYALTPVTVLMIGITLPGLEIPYVEFIYLFMYVAFLLGALSSCVPRPQAAEDEKRTDDWDGFI
jgi:hypothetical protein